MSARPTRTATWTSFTNTPRPPISQIGTSGRRSPAVSTTSTSTGASSNEATCSVCHRANRLPLVAARSARLTPAPLPHSVLGQESGRFPARGRDENVVRTAGGAHGGGEPYRRTSKAEQGAERLGQPVAAGRPGRLLHDHGRLVQQLG